MKASYSDEQLPLTDQEKIAQLLSDVSTLNSKMDTAESDIDALQLVALDGDSLSQQALDRITDLESANPEWTDLSSGIYWLSSSPMTFRLPGTLDVGEYRVTYDSRDSGNAGGFTFIVPETVSANVSFDFALYTGANMKIGITYNSTDYSPDYWFIEFSATNQLYLETIEYRSINLPS
jgi:outer membrane murein-binding lipoprotein Lpp